MRRYLMYSILGALIFGAPAFAADVATGSRGEALSETGAKSPESGVSRRLMVSDATSPLAARTVTEDPLERQTLDIAKDLRCTVCQNQPVSESNSDLARDMRAIIREQLQAGKTRDEIVEYFVTRYGDYVLLKPPFHERGLFLWIGPLLLLIAAGGFAWYFIRRRAATPAAPAPVLSPQDLARIDAARREN